MHKQTLMAVIAQYWPGVALAGGAALALASWAGSHDFVNGVVHDDQFNRLKWQVEEGARANSLAHSKMEDGVTEIKTGVNKLLEVQRNQGESIARLEGRRYYDSKK